MLSSNYITHSDTEELDADTAIIFKPIDPTFTLTSLLPEWNPEAWLTSDSVFQEKHHDILQDISFVNVPWQFDIRVGASERSVENETSWDQPLIPDPCSTDPIHGTDLSQFLEHTGELSPLSSLALSSILTAQLSETGLREEVSTSFESGVSHEPSINCPSALEPRLAWTAENDICDAEDFGHVPRISMDIYNIIRTKFDDLDGDSSKSQSFAQAEFPSSTVLNAFIQSYFEYFHPGFPMLHKPSFDPSSNESSWLLVLAVATIGCRFSLASSPQILFLLQESLRRSIIRIVGTKSHPYTQGADPSSFMWIMMNVWFTTCC